MICNEYVGLYFFSAVFQGNMALLALLGVFLVFKRQEINTELQGRDSSLIAFIQNTLDFSQSPGKHVPINYSDMASLKTEIEKMSTSDPKNVQAMAKVLLGQEEFLSRFKEREGLITKRGNLFSSMKPAFNWTLAAIIISLTILPFVHSIHRSFPFAELALIISMIILNIWALVEVKKYIWKTLKE